MHLRDFFNGTDIPLDSGERLFSPVVKLMQNAFVGIAACHKAADNGEELMSPDGDSGFRNPGFIIRG